ncbi:hypothetical protein AVEN_258494-1 [Araneus ventricosus]|uniref:Uncharacterized protein n=1 Tax=Araneus ventricosus TaxID=182803 RepID=A0A4Y2HA41_ARAVE|nr:hypothetical protein AVEN_258494-1 [Araneus ventricosus]
MGKNVQLQQNREDESLLPPRTGAKNKIKPRLPSDSSYSKCIFPNINSCYSDRLQPGKLAGRVLFKDRQYSFCRTSISVLLKYLEQESANSGSRAACHHSGKVTGDMVRIDRYGDKILVCMCHFLKSSGEKVIMSRVLLTFVTPLCSFLCSYMWL